MYFKKVYLITQADPTILQRVGVIMGGKPELNKTTLHWVRNVAPKKDMYCISFPLNSELAFANPK